MSVRPWSVRLFGGIALALAISTLPALGADSGREALQRASRLLMDGRRDEALTAMEKVVVDYSQGSDAQYAEAAVRRLQGLYVGKSGVDSALKSLQDLVKGREQTRAGSTAAYMVGKLQQDRGEPDAAMSAYRESTKRSGNCRAAFDSTMGIGELGLRAGAGEKALSILADVRNRYPSSQMASYALYEMGRIYDSRKDETSAFDCYKRAVTEQAVVPGEVQTGILEVCRRYYRQGFAAAGSNEYQKAVAEFQKVIDLKPIREQMSLDRMVDFANEVQGSREVAIRDVGVEARFQKGICHQVLGQTDQALAEFEALLKEAPDSEFATHAMNRMEKIRSASSK